MQDPRKSSESPSSLPSPKVRLDDFRSDLIRQEETIIFALIERAQFRQNLNIYAPGQLANLSCSFLEFFLGEMERVHSLSRRYTAPDEHPFFPSKLVEPILPPLNFSPILKPNTINLNAKVLSMYTEKIVPMICPPGDDQQYGSSANLDVAALYAISKRVHYGKFIAEAKFQQEREQYTNLIANNDVDGLAKLLTNEEVEKKLLKRVHLKASTYGKDPEEESSGATFKVNPDSIVNLYKDFFIPLNKEVQVRYLLERLKPVVVGYLGPPTTFSHQAALKEFPTGRHEPLANFAEVFSAVVSNKANFGVVPIENSTAGKVQGAVELFMETSLKVSAEVYLGVSLHLLVSSTFSGKLVKIYSHEKALEQCKKFLDENYKNVERVAVASTAKAAELASKEAHSAAVASALAGAELKMKSLREDIQDSSNNFTRFFVIGKFYAARSGKDKTLLRFSVSGGASLSAALGSFAKNGVIINTIDSCPTKGAPWSYRYLLQCDGHFEDEPVKRVLGELREHTTGLYVLGSFPDLSSRLPAPK